MLPAANRDMLKIIIAIYVKYDTLPPPTSKTVMPRTTDIVDIRNERRMILVKIVNFI